MGAKGHQFLILNILCFGLARCKFTLSASFFYRTNIDSSNSIIVEFSIL